MPHSLFGHRFGGGGGGGAAAGIDPVARAAAAAAQADATLALEWTASAGEDVPVGASRYAGGRQWVNGTNAVITLPATPDPPTIASLTLAGLTDVTEGAKEEILTLSVDTSTALVAQSIGDSTAVIDVDTDGFEIVIVERNGANPLTLTAGPGYTLQCGQGFIFDSTFDATFIDPSETGPLASVRINDDLCSLQFAIIGTNIYLIGSGGSAGASPAAPADNQYLHTQTVASTLWVVNHGLGTTQVDGVNVYVGNQKVFPGVTVVDANTINLMFSVAQTGYAIIEL